jgi:multiple sugar transport system permease protein/raffinose/stachyose/melibiose transport system permease protein
MIITKPKSKELLKWMSCFVFAVPALFFFTVFVFIPLLGTIRYSFFRWNGASSNMTFLGMGNYIELIKDQAFWLSFKNNIIWILFTIFVPVLMGLVLATFISQPFVKAKIVYRLTYFMPNVVSLVAVGIVWGWIYNPEFGILERILAAINFPGAHEIDFLGDPKLVIWFLVIAGSWTAYGFNMTVFLAAIQGIDTDYLEVAILEGANYFQTFFWVILPIIKGTVTLMVLNSLIGSFKVFDIIWIMTKGGPYHSSDVIATYMYLNAFNQNRYGYGSAMAVVLTIIIAICSIIYIRVREREI